MSSEENQLDEKMKDNLDSGNENQTCLSKKEKWEEER